MNNMFMLIRRLTAKPELIETEAGQKICTIDLAVNRNYKNTEGIYETDFIKCQLWNGIAENTIKYCDKGDLIAVRGRIETRNNNMILIADKVAFLSKKEKESEE